MSKGLIIIRLRPSVGLEKRNMVCLGDIARIFCDAKHVWVNQIILPDPEHCGYCYEAIDIAHMIQRRVPVRVEFLGEVCTHVLSRTAMMWEKMQDWMNRWGGYDRHEP